VTQPTADEIVQALIRAARAVTDPDPEREVTACGDCSTPQVALTSAEEVGYVLGILHDASCPRYARMTADERTQMFDDGAVCHVVRPEAEA
jgi:hypothetical protein